jgi:peptidylprolyl isomerase
MRSTWLRAFRLLLPLGSAASCASAAPVPAQTQSSAASDAKAVLQQELGEMPAPKGPCPERTQPNVLTDPRAPVQRTALGLAYCLLHEGPPGQVPGSEDTVRVHYSGWNAEGELFDSSVERGQPLDLPLNGVIRGWTEGLRLMTPGDKARLWIPGNLGYGRQEPGSPPGTPPKGTLVFDIELIDVVRSAAAEPPPASEPASPAPESDSRPTLAPRPL